VGLVHHPRMMITLGEVSEITERIIAYGKTRPQNWAALRDWLAQRDYPPNQQSEHPEWNDSSDLFYTEGSWDEVTRAVNVGNLTEAEYLEVVKAAAAYKGR